MADSQPTGQPRQRPFMKSLLFWVVALICAIGLIDLLNVGIGIRMPVIRGPESHRGVGQTLAFLDLTPLTGNVASLSTSDLQNHVTLLNFWGTWCPPCREELPHMAGLRQRFAGQEAFRLAAISYPPGGQDGDAESLREETETLLKRLNLDLPTYSDPGDRTRAAVDQVVGFEGFPTTLLLDRHGVIRAVWVGYRPGVETEMERYVDKALSEIER